MPSIKYGSPYQSIWMLRIVQTGKNLGNDPILEIAMSFFVEYRDLKKENMSADIREINRKYGTLLGLMNRDIFLNSDEEKRTFDTWEYIARTLIYINDRFKRLIGTDSFPAMKITKNEYMLPFGWNDSCEN